MEISADQYLNTPGSLGLPAVAILTFVIKGIVSRYKGRTLLVFKTFENNHET